MSRFALGAGILGAGVVIGGLVLTLCVETIDQGHVGVVYNRNGGIEEKTLGQGWHLVGITQRVTEYPVSTETVEQKFTIATSDGKPVDIEMTYNYHIEPTKVPGVFNKFKGQPADVLEQGFLKSRLKAAAQSVTSNYTVLDLFGSDFGKISAEIQKRFTEDPEVKDTGFVIEAFALGTPHPDEKTQAAIQAKVDAQQALETQKIQLEKEKIMAEQKRVQAQAEADAALIKAQGQAKANKELQQSITQELIQYEYAKKWDGKYPLATGGNNWVNIPVPQQSQK